MGAPDYEPAYYYGVKAEFQGKEEKIFRYFKLQKPSPHPGRALY